MASWARAARRCVQAGAASMLRPAVSATGEAQAALRPSLPVFAQQSRGMASSGHHGEGVTYGGLTLYKPQRWQVMWGEGLAGLMWFWVLVRCYHDGETLFFGHAVVFEREEREAREHAAAHGHAEHGDGGHAEHSASGHAEEPAAVVPPSNTEDVLAEKDAVAPA